MPVEIEVLKISVNGTDISFAIRFTIKFPYHHGRHFYFD